MNNEIVTGTYHGLVSRIDEILALARNNVVRQINQTQVMAYWEIGREIVEFEQEGKARGEYGMQLMEKLSKDMIQKFGRGFSPTNLKMMRLFYQKFPIRQTLSDESEKPQTLSAKSTEEQKSKTSSGKSCEEPIRQSLPDESQKYETLSVKFQPMLSWSHYRKILKVSKLRYISLTDSNIYKKSIKNKFNLT